MKRERSELVDFAPSSVNDTSASSPSTSTTDLFKSMDADGDGTLSQTELADGTKKLFYALRTQVMTTSVAGGTASSTSSTDATIDAATSTASASDAATETSTLFVAA